MTKKINTEVNHVSAFGLSKSGKTAYFLLEIALYDISFPIFVIDDSINGEQLRQDFSEFLLFNDDENEAQFYDTICDYHETHDYDMAIPNNINYWMLIAKHSQIANRDIIAHECIHIKNRLFRKKGIKPDFVNDEPEAYLMGFLFREIEKIFNQVIELKLLK